jgi:HlyD family secretion protein
MTHDHPPHPVSGRTRRRLVVAFLLVVGLVGAAAGAGLLKGFLPNSVVAGDPKASGRGDPAPPAVQTVKVIRPRIDSGFRVTTNQLAVVEAFYQAGLRARVSGVVRGVAKDIGDPVRAGELLIDIDTPDLRLAVEQKDAVIAQRLQEVRATEHDAKTAAAAVELSKASVAQRTADVTAAENIRAAKLKKFERYKTLGTSVTPDLLDEAELEYRAAAASVMSANAAVQKARAEQTEKEASAEAATADIDLKRTLVDVARKDRDAAATQLAYARLHAPFDGVVTHRGTDPGRFVSNATTGGGGEALVTVSRVDLVTVAMKIPDSAAGFITPNTEVFVEFAQLPGVTARGPITRFSPSIDTTDRTMRVEVDVFNGSAEEYQKLLGRAAADHTLSSLVPLDPLAMAAAAGAGMVRSRASHKGWTDGNALPADRTGDGRFRQIVPGTMANVRVSLDNFADARLLPSGAVFNRAGQPYILLVEDGVTRAVPVVVQVNDGRLVKVAMTSTVGGRQTVTELTGNEQVVATRQVEVGDGVKVNPVAAAW